MVNHLRIFLLIILIPFIQLLSQGSDPELVPDKKYDIIKYKAFIDFEKANDSFIRGSNTFIIESEEQIIPTITFHLEGLEVLNVTNSDGSILNHTLMEENNPELKYYSVDYEPGSEFEGIVVNYEGQLGFEEYSDWGGVHNDPTGLYSIGVGFRNPYVSTTRHWLPCFDHPSDKAEFDLTFFTADENSIVSIGEKKIVEENETGTIVNWKTEIPTATYLVSFFHGEFVTTDLSNEKYKNEIYHNAAFEPYIEPVFGYTNEMVESLAKVLDEPYPYEKIGHYIMASPAAMEHQTLIAFGRGILLNYYNENDTLGSTVVHEIGHHWFGNLVSPKSFADAWLNESFTTNSEALFYEEYFNSRARYWQRVREHGEAFLGGTFSTDGAIPIYGYDRSLSTNYPGTIYRKGSVMLGLLRHKIGDENFFAALREYIDRYKFSNASTQDAIDVFEEISNQDLSDFFDQWLYGVGYPALGVKFRTVGDNATVEFDQQQKDIWQNFTELWLPISWKDNNGDSHEMIYEFTGENDVAILGQNVDYSTVELNRSDSLYVPVLILPSSGIDKDLDQIIKIDNKNKVISIIDETFNCPNVSLYNLNGQEIFNKKNCSKKLVTNSFDRGLYLIKIEESGREFTGKIILE